MFLGNKYRVLFCFSLVFPGLCFSTEKKTFDDIEFTKILNPTEVKLIRIVVTSPGMTTRSSLSEDSLEKFGCSYESDDFAVINAVQSLVRENIDPADHADVDRMDLRNEIYFLREGRVINKILINDFPNSGKKVSAKIKSDDAESSGWVKGTMQRDLMLLVGKYLRKFTISGSKCAPSEPYKKSEKN